MFIPRSVYSGDFCDFWSTDWTLCNPQSKIFLSSLFVKRKTNPNQTANMPKVSISFWFGELTNRNEISLKAFNQEPFGPAWQCWDLHEQPFSSLTTDTPLLSGLYNHPTFCPKSLLLIHLRPKVTHAADNKLVHSWTHFFLQVIIIQI